MPISRVTLTGAWQQALAPTVDTVLEMQFGNDGGEWLISPTADVPTDSLYGMEVQRDKIQQIFVPAGEYLFARGSGADTLFLNTMDNQSPFVDARVYVGTQAITTQSCAEVQAKLGLQYEAAYFNAALAASGVADFILITGAEPVTIRQMEVQFNSELISTQYFQAPTYTGGAAVAIHNLYPGGAVAGEFSILSTPSITATGTAVSVRNYTIGTEIAGGGGGTRTGRSSLTAAEVGHGVSRILSPNTTYLYRLINEDATNAAIVSWVGSWYEGPLSV